MRTTACTTIVAAALALLAASAGAQSPAPAQPGGPVAHPTANEIQVIPSDQANQRNGVLARSLFAAPLVDAKGERVGIVTDIVVGPDNRALGVIVEAPGGLALGQSRFRVRWADMADVGQPAIRVPVTADDVGGISLFGRSPPPGAATEPLPQGAWVVSQVLGDRLEAENGRSEGRVVDVLLEQDGRIAALVMGSPVPAPLGDAGVTQPSPADAGQGGSGQ